MLSLPLLLAFLAGAGPAQPPPDTPTQVKPKVTPETRGDIYMARKMYREAVEAYREGPKGDAVILNKTGIAYHQMLELGVAKRYYEQAVKAKSDYAEAINNLGTVYYTNKSYRRAISQYKKALRYAPESASIYSNLGTAWFARKNYKDASKCYEKALSLDRNVFENHSTTGVLLQQQSVDERAKFHYFLSKTYANAGDNERALQYMRKCIEEGFRDRKKFQEDPEFAKLRDLPEFKELLVLEPRVL